MLFNHGVPKRAALHLQLPPLHHPHTAAPWTFTSCSALPVPFPPWPLKDSNSWYIVSPFYCKGLTYPVPLRHSSICTCFGPQCPQKPTGCTGESYKTSEAGPVLSYEGDRPCFRKGSSCQLAFMFTDSLSTLNQLQPQTPGAFHSHPDISI